MNGESFVFGLKIYHTLKKFVYNDANARVVAIVNKLKFLKDNKNNYKNKSHPFCFFKGKYVESSIES